MTKEKVQADDPEQKFRGIPKVQHVPMVFEISVLLRNDGRCSCRWSAWRCSSSPLGHSLPTRGDRACHISDPLDVYDDSETVLGSFNGSDLDGPTGRLRLQIMDHPSPR